MIKFRSFLPDRKTDYLECTMNSLKAYKNELLVIITYVYLNFFEI